MKVLVTGATGFLGSHIVDACLNQGDSVKVLVRYNSNLSYLKTLNVEFVFGDLHDRASLLQATLEVDVIYHSAARVLDYGTRAQFLQTNVIGTKNLVAAAKQNNIDRFVFISSPSVVMSGKDQLDIDESEPYSSYFYNLYSETKALAEQYVLSQNSVDFITCSLRPRAIWGPRDKQGTLPRMLAKIRDGKLPNMSGGRSVKASMCYCTNAAHACLLAARSERVGGKSYFITDTEQLDIWSFASYMANRYNLPPITRQVSPKLIWYVASLIDLVWKIPYLSNHLSPPLPRYTVGLLTLNSTYKLNAAKADLGYAPIVNLEQGLHEIDKWMGDDGLDKYIGHL
ncbi:MAG: NAD-dependent epimerase/dehydratase family protein [Moritella sp.]|uniref:NAD-dependent epimerase/dehydratase family protein n=1 Tax=Moritella sp. TaxID=78556 RepID=UPI000C11898B|nr:NAD-dependent epimerase/dehydratase family protein [Moritella sp.]MBL1415802.1 NAD-dependent epimerase/dehydratase family protein [Moritella sp.]